MTLSVLFTNHPFPLIPRPAAGHHCARYERRCRPGRQVLTQGVRVLEQDTATCPRQIHVQVGI